MTIDRRRLRAFGATALAACTLWVAAATSPLHAEGAGPMSAWIEGYNSRVRIMAGHDGSGANRQLTAGVEIETKPDWKTYWRNPGDAGVPPNFDWSRSENVAAVKVGYPPPSRLVDKSGTTIGYLGRVVFPAVVTPADPSKPVRLRLAIEYGVCKDICVPAQAEAEIDLPPGGAMAMPRELVEAVAALPRPAGHGRPGDPVVKNVRVTLGGGAPQIVIDVAVPGGARDADAFLVAEDGGFVPLPEREITSANGSDTGIARFVVDLGKDVDLKELAGKSVFATITGPKGATELAIPIR